VVPARSIDIPRAAVASATDGLNMTRIDHRRVEWLGAFRCGSKGVDEGLKIDFERSSPAD
jgi:hypothetical protein